MAFPMNKTDIVKCVMHNNQNYVIGLVITKSSGDDSKKFEEFLKKNYIGMSSFIFFMCIEEYQNLMDKLLVETGNGAKKPFGHTIDIYTSVGKIFTLDI